MPLPAIPTNTVIQAVFRATQLNNDPASNPLENVQWFQYVAGFAPEPAGIPLNDMAFRALGQWATVWRPFQAQDAFFFSCTLRAVASFIPTDINRYLAVLASQWTDNSPQTAGAVASPSVPSFNAYGIRKLTALPGRGKQGQIRVTGVPILNTAGNLVDPGVLAALAAALTPTALNLNVSTAMAFSDTLFPVIINGRLVNTTTGQPPPFYIENVQGFTPTDLLATQVTRKQGRHRS